MRENNEGKSYEEGRGDAGKSKFEKGVPVEAMREKAFSVFLASVESDSGEGGRWSGQKIAL